ncbi:MAG: hypothetical protein Q8S92_23560 [Hydrogenophaga sp.]|jgi:PHD/YefM family antitoxin component YafN of YafNO toxin-antitoxin module|uniref:type II toxin-antitoxin system Phd/YefM family antitoxin n=1 Tax=Hydrogenophaga sp. TaxID=1904254 RepID=UPI002734A597|nr:hypothetical protein [Hydrogenophaga sp.]MDP3351974.1 hypothetical protein [Hydrogenophaga sp.]
MNVLKVTPQQVDLFSLVEKANESANPIFLRTKQGSAVVVSQKEWETLQEMLVIFNTPGVRKDLQEAIESITAPPSPTSVTDNAPRAELQDRTTPGIASGKQARRG